MKKSTRAAEGREEVKQCRRGGKKEHIQRNEKMGREGGKSIHKKRKKNIFKHEW